MKKIYHLLWIALFCTIVTGCGSEHPTDYEVGVIYTTEYYDKSEIVYLDKSWQPVGKTKFRYSNMSYDGFYNCLTEDNTIYLLPKGKSQRLDCGKICAFDRVSGEMTEYDFDRVNITDYNYDEKYVYAVSNLNGIYYLDRINKETRELTTYEHYESDLDKITLIDGKVYGISVGLEGDRDTYKLCLIDMDKKSYTKVCDLEIKRSPVFLENHNGKIYIPNDEELFVYDTINHNSYIIELPYSDGYNLNKKDNVLYIGHTDIFNGTTSHITALDLATEEISHVMDYNGIILQMEFVENNVYICDYEELFQYEINEAKEPILKNSYTLDHGGNFYPGSFFLKPIETK